MCTASRQCPSATTGTPCPILKVNVQGQCQGAERGLVTRDLGALGMRVCVKQAEKVAKRERTLEWLAAEGNNE